MKNKSVYILLSIVLFSIIMHLKGITSPLLDFHAWRQTQTAMIARNYYENGFKFFNPQVDWYGQESNKRAGTEFPVFSFIIALLYKMFGMHDILGRFLAVFFSAMSSVYLFLLLRKYFEFWYAYISTLIFIILPINIYFTRTVQPESIMLFSIISGLYYFINYLENPSKILQLIFSFVLLTIAPLVKLPSLYVLLPIGFLAYNKWGWKVIYRIEIWLFNIFLVSNVFLWYRFAKTGMDVLPLKINDYIYMLKILGQPKFWIMHFLSRFVELTTTYAGLLFFIIGFWFIVLKKHLYFFGVWFISVVIYIIAIGEYGYIHQYTALPYAPINAVFIGGGIVYASNKYSLLKINKILLILLIISIPLHSLLRIRNWYKLSDLWLLNAKEDVSRISEKNDLFLCNSKTIPIQLYHIDRKGFSIDILKSDLNEVKYLIKKDMSFFLTANDKRWSDDNEIGKYFIKNYKVVCENEDYKIFDLRKKI